MEMRKCKECGELFLPKGREQYCSKTHYRPCPVCGAPVIAKYLSDPPRKCDACRGKKTAPAVKPLFKLPQEAVAEMISPEPAQPKDDRSWMNKVDPVIPETMPQPVFCETLTGSIRMYIGNAHKNNFIPGHEYVIDKIEREEGAYMVHSCEDVTSGDDCDITMHYASQISFYQNFGRKRQKASIQA